jgi:opacity protein-like surface antigen
MNVKVMMLIASIFGALAGLLLITVAKPDYDFYVWFALFAVIGIGVGNLALLVLYKTYEWIKT